MLELHSNQLGATGASALANALKHNHSVRALNFNDNDLCDEGAEAVASMLAVNTSVATMGLAGNRLRKRAAVALASALVQGSYALTGLDLGNNELVQTHSNTHAVRRGIIVWADG